MREENVIRYYLLCNRLKNVIRTGWLDWNVNKDRLESVAEHIFGVQMLAIAMKSEYNYDVDIMKVIMMLAVHELEEIIIGDLTLFDKDIDDKKEIGHKAIDKVLSGLVDKDKIRSLILEFDERKTNEAKFAYYCDKLECDLQAKIYDEENCVNLLDQYNNKSMDDNDVRLLLNSGMSWGEMWLVFGQKRYNYDDNFLSVSNYVKDNKIKKLIKEMD